MPRGESQFTTRERVFWLALATRSSDCARHHLLRRGRRLRGSQRRCGRCPDLSESHRSRPSRRAGGGPGPAASVAADGASEACPRPCVVWRCDLPGGTVADGWFTIRCLPAMGLPPRSRCITSDRWTTSVPSTGGFTRRCARAGASSTPMRRCRHDGRRVSRGIRVRRGVRAAPAGARPRTQVRPRRQAGGCGELSRSQKGWLS